MNFVYS